MSPYVKNMFCWQLIRVLVQFFLNFKHQNFERKAKHINPSNVQKKYMYIDDAMMVQLADTCNCM